MSCCARSLRLTVRYVTWRGSAELRSEVPSITSSLHRAHVLETKRSCQTSRCFLSAIWNLCTLCSLPARPLDKALVRALDGRRGCSTRSLLCHAPPSRRHRLISTVAWSQRSTDRNASSERAQAANVAVSIACCALSCRSRPVTRLHDSCVQAMVQDMDACHPAFPEHTSLDFRHPGRNRVGSFCGRRSRCAAPASHSWTSRRPILQLPYARLTCRDA